MKRESEYMLDFDERESLSVFNEAFRMITSGDIKKEEEFFEGSNHNGNSWLHQALLVDRNLSSAEEIRKMDDLYDKKCSTISTIMENEVENKVKAASQKNTDNSNSSSNNNNCSNNIKQKENNETMSISHMDYVSPPRRRRRKEEVRVPDDGYLWLKYGQKDLMGSSYTRAYYRCKEKDKGCPAKRTVDRQKSDTAIMQIVYEEDHNHPPTNVVGQDQSVGGTPSGISPKSAQSASSAISLDSPQSATYKQHQQQQQQDCVESEGAYASGNYPMTVADLDLDTAVANSTAVILKPMNKVLPNLGFSSKPNWTSFNPNGNFTYVSTDSDNSPHTPSLWSASSNSSMDGSNLSSPSLGFTEPQTQLQLQQDSLRRLLLNRYGSAGLGALLSDSQLPLEKMLSALSDTRLPSNEVGSRASSALASPLVAIQPLQPPMFSSFERDNSMVEPPKSNDLIAGDQRSQVPVATTFDPFAFLGGADTFRLADFMS